MRDLLPSRFVLLTVLMCSVALASDSCEESFIRNEMISDHPGLSTSSVYVSGQIVTVLRFEKEVDPAKTKLAGVGGAVRAPARGGQEGGPRADSGSQPR